MFTPPDTAHECLTAPLNVPIHCYDNNIKQTTVATTLVRPIQI